MTRRRLIKLAGLSLASFVLPVTWSSRLRADALFDSMFGNPSFAARMGLAHRLVDPSASERGLGLAADLAAAAPSVREGRFRSKVDRDLAALDVVVVDGWVMARSEADFCAAVHLERTPA